MNSKMTTAFFTRKKFFLLPFFGLIGLGRFAEAQQQVIQPQTPPVESTAQLTMTNDFQVFAPQPSASTPGPYEPFRWDQFVARPHADYQFIDAYGLLAAPGDHENTTIQEISPGILLNLGPHWALDYTALIGLYSNNHFGTEFDNSITLTGQTTYNDWVFGFVQSIVLSDSPLIETGGQTSQQNYTTTVTAHHENSQYISEDLEVAQNILEVAGGFENQRGWSTMDWLNYQPQSRFNIGIGPGLGYNNADFGPDSVYEQGQARMNWRATDKLSFQLSGGVEETEFLGGQSAGDVFSPIYGGIIQYQPFSETQISFSANRSISPSYFVGEYAEETSVGASFSQRFLGQIYFNAYGSYNNLQYIASATDVLADRTDKFYSLSLRLSHSFLQRGNVAIFYQYSSDNSTFPGYSFSSHQYGVEVSYAF